MGLDGVELVMEWEEAFGVELKDEELSESTTPRKVIDLIFSKLKTADERVCRNQRAFYAIRKVLIRTFGLERKSISPDVQIRERIPKSREKEAWEHLRAALSPRSWPGLQRPVWMFRSLMGFALAIFGAMAFLAIRLSSNIPAGVMGGAVCAVLFGIIAARLTRPFCRYIPADVRSIRDMIPYAITSDRIAGWTREEVAAVVKRLTVEQIGLKESEYTEDSRFVQDFRID